MVPTTGTTGSAAHAPIEQLAGDVHVPHVACRLLDQVEYGPAEGGRAEVAPGGQVERCGLIEDGVGVMPMPVLADELN